MKGSFHRGPWSLRGLERLVRRCPVGGVQGTSARHEEPPGAWGQTSGARRGHSTRPKAGGAGSLRQGDQLSRLAVMRVGSARGRGSGESGQQTEQGTEVKLPHGGPARAPAHAPGILWRGARSV